MKLITISTFMLVSLSALAQQQDQILARVRYSFIHQRDTNQRNNPYTENMLLLVGKNESLYTSYDQIIREDKQKKLENERVKNQAGGAPVILNKNSAAPFKPVTLVDYYFYVKENKWVTKDKVMIAYLVEEDAPIISWKLTKDTVNISGISCKQASAYFKGRNWMVWYAPSLPFQSGPWKLNGLPGLIIEAYDEKKEVQFLFAGLEKLNKENTNEESFYFGSNFKLPKDAKKASRAEFDKLKEAFNQDPIGFHAAASGLPRNKIFTGSSTTGIVHHMINNPIELPANK